MNNFSSSIKIWLALCLLFCFQNIYAQTNNQKDNEEEEVDFLEEDTTLMRYPLRDRQGDFYSTPSTNSFNPYRESNAAINKSLIYNPQDKSFLAKEQVLGTAVRPTMRFNNQEVNNISFKKAEALYFRKKVNTNMFLSQRGGIPRFSATNFIFNNVFGVNTLGQRIKNIFDTTKSRFGKSKKSLQQILPFSTGVKPLGLDTSFKTEGELKNQLGINNPDSLASQVGKKILKSNEDEVKKAIADFEKSQTSGINPKGFVDFVVGAENFSTNNPSIPINLRSTTVPLLDVKYDVNLNSTIGSKLSLPISASNLNNLDLKNPLYVVSGISAASAVAATANAINSSSGPNGGVSGFNPNTSSFSSFFQQSLKRVKISYKGDEDQVIKKIELGVTQFETPSNIIPSTKELFGANVKMQFGKLTFSSVVAFQTSKLKTINLNDGSLVKNVKIKVGDYEDNKNYILSHYFRKNFNSALKKLPLVNSNVQILRVEVWVTNRNATPNETREIIAFSDMGECGTDLTNPTAVTCLTGNGAAPDNNNNSLYKYLKENPSVRTSALAIDILTQAGFKQGRDFEKVYVKKVLPTNLYFHPTLGVLLLNEGVTNESVVAISYEYQMNGRVYRVGEFSEEISLSNDGLTKLLFTKLLKTIIPDPALPVWQLMMKNVYNLGVGQVKKDNFNLFVTYDEPGRGERIYLPYADPQHQKTLISLMNSDRLNNNNDFIQDGIFDYVENVTIFPDIGKLMFPVLEPFGRDLEYIFTDINLAKRYLYYSLYDSIKSYALQQIQSNRFTIKGNVKNTNSAQIFLGAFNIPPGSVKITQSGTPLQEGKDFIIDYNIGALTILNKSILDAKLPLLVSLEDNGVNSFQQKNFLGFRGEYAVSKNLAIGATYTKLSELPLNNKVAYGQESVNNQLYGIDVNYKVKTRALSYFLDKMLPIYVTKEISQVNIFGELVKYNPSYNTIDLYSTPGSIYLDDFENSYSNIWLNTIPSIQWSLSSVPNKATNKAGQILFPESSLTNSLDVGKSRAHLAWYQIDANLQIQGAANNPISNINFSDPRWRLIPTTEVFPSIITNYTDIYARTFDLAFFPTEKGPFNFETSSTELDANGNFLFPEKKFGGISFGFQDQANFEDRNVAYIQFWMQDPFLENPNSNGGDMYINLGNISEDILNDNLRFYENGINTPSFPAQMTSSIWGQVPNNPTSINNDFINVAGERPLQDVGLDGIPDAIEKTHFADYLNNISQNFGETSPFYQKAFQDPSADNFRSERDHNWPSNTDILQRYKYHNNTQGNSQIPGVNDNQVFAATIFPDKEDLNNDNILNQSEDYFQYVLNLKPNMQIGTNYIVDIRTVSTTIQLPTESAPTQRTVNWYLIKIPIHSYYSKVGNIQDFKSIRFMRMFLTNFKENAVIRMLKLGLVSNNWRNFNYEINHTGIYVPTNNDNLLVTNVNIEENTSRTPIPYVLPPQIERVQQVTSNSNIILQNEQSMSLRIMDLKPQDPKGVFKNVNLNLINYGKINMFLHAESVLGQPDIQDGEMEAVVRLSTDYVNHYYEIRIPLKITPVKTSYIQREEIWPAENNLDIALKTLTSLKEKRNLSNVSITEIFSELSNGKIISVMGNPSLADISGVLIYVNNKTTMTKSVEVWVDELRLSEVNLQNAYAGYTKVDVKLADLGTMSIVGSFHTPGFGNLEQKTNERYRDNFKQYSISSRLDLSKLLPDNLKMNIPFYMNISESISTPEYDPFDTDIKLQDKINARPADASKLLNRSIDQTKTQTYSVTNVRVLAKKGEAPAFYSIKHWEFSYTFSAIEKSSPYVETFDFTNYNTSAAYNYSPIIKYLEPFKKIKSRKEFSSVIKNLNFNFIPSNVSFKVTFDRQFTVTKARSVFEDDVFQMPEYYDKKFIINRLYGVKWNFTKSIFIDFKVTNFSRVDEPYGRINDWDKTKIVWEHLLKGGRNTFYKQDMNINYVLPTQNIKAINWIISKVSYTTSYDWITASDSLFYLGHTIQNMNKQEADVNFDFITLFKKFKISQPKLAKVNIKQKLLPTPELSWWQNLLFGFQRMRFTISDVYSSTVNGFIFTPQLIGNNLSNFAPGLDYAFGGQPNKQWLDAAASKKWITNSTELNQNYLQSYSRVASLDFSIKPMAYLEIQLLFNYSFGKNYSELFKDTTGNGTYAHLNPFVTGKFDISYWAFETMFDRYTNSSLTTAFKNLIDNRTILSARLAKEFNVTQITDGGYYKGYDQYAQSVLIPSFIAAYTGGNVNNIPLINNKNNTIKDNPFSGFFPLPSWKITYYGLVKIPGLNKIFSVIKLTNNYTGNMNSNNISMNPTYLETQIGIPLFIDPLSGNFVPYYRIPNITIMDKFDPLIGVDIITKSQIGFGFKYSKERVATVSLVDFQVSENYKEQYSFNFSYKIRGFKKFEKYKKLKPGFRNELLFKFDLSYMQDFNFNIKLNQIYKTPTGGNVLYAFLPSIEYLSTKNLTFKLFYEYRLAKNNLTQLENINQRGGLLIRFSFN